MTETECRAVLERSSVARLGCALDGQPYVVPVFYAYESDSVYVFSTVGQKIEWMRRNPKVCLQVDEISSDTRWFSVVANGRYEELADDDHPRARRLLEQKHVWWLNAVTERRSRTEDLAVDPLFFRIRIDSLTGLHSMDTSVAAG